MNKKIDYRLFPPLLIFILPQATTKRSESIALQKKKKNIFQYRLKVSIFLRFINAHQGFQLPIEAKITNNSPNSYFANF
jgi:hypothetical protein